MLRHVDSPKRTGRAPFECFRNYKYPYFNACTRLKVTKLMALLSVRDNRKVSKPRNEATQHRPDPGHDIVHFAIPGGVSFTKRAAAPKAAAVAVLWLLTVLTVVPAQGQQDQPDDTLKINTNLISVPVIVSDRAGHYVPNLRKQDFKLYDNSVEQKIAFFDAGAEPLNVVLLLDTSRSTRGVRDDIKNAARDFLRALRPKDRAMVISFDKEVRQLCPLTNDRKMLETAIKQTAVSQYFGTLLDDAVLETTKTVLPPVTGRKAIILLTDGEDGGSQIDAKDLLAYESEVDAMIYPIYYEAFLHTGSGGLLPRLRGIFGGSEQKRPQQKERAAAAIAFLTKLSEVTGGRFFSSSATNLREAFDLIARELRYQYRLGFYPSEAAPGGSLRTLGVRVDRPNVAVRARRQYRTRPAS